MSQVPPELLPDSYRTQFDTAFQISPILLQYGIVQPATNGGFLPISQITGFGEDGEPFARYMPLPGSTLVNQAIGMYPFANQSVAANATIQQPLTLSMMMIAPVNQPGGYLSKLHTFSSLQQALTAHNAAGGMYVVATPAFVYNNLLMTTMTDVTSEENLQKQIQWQLDFIQPILTLQAAAAQENALIQKYTNGSKLTNFNWSGQDTASPATLTSVTAALGAFGGTIPQASPGSQTPQ